MILIVEDNAEFSKTFAMALTGAGFEVDVAEDGARALAALLSRPYSLALVDLVLPDMDGARVLAMAREAGCAVPMIAITGALPVDLPTDGFIEVFEKPLRLSTLVELTKKYAGKPVAGKIST